mmetsp:Transcript_11516/g.18345  ORF Transcript_11516/g.18345 Transcript_11516/m.18345 type:complete len:80 (-) Transcript_11516:239-478(-)
MFVSVTTRFKCSSCTKEVYWMWATKRLPALQGLQVAQIYTKTNMTKKMNRMNLANDRYRSCCANTKNPFNPPNLATGGF